MRKLYDAFFAIPEEKKISEKTMTIRVITSVFIIVGCLVAMSLTAYAYFSYNVTSKFDAVRAANFETAIRIVDEEGNPVDISTVVNNHKYYTAELEAKKLYTVTITPAENNTANKGFVLLCAIGCKEQYHTQQLGTDTSVEGGETTEISFTIQVTDDAKVAFVPHWGTSSYYGYNNQNEDIYIMQNEEVVLIINDITDLEELEPTPTPLPTATPLPTESPLPEATVAPTESPLPEATIAPEVTPSPEATLAPQEITAPLETAKPEEAEPEVETVAPEGESIVTPPAGEDSVVTPPANEEPVSETAASEIQVDTSVTITNEEGTS